MTKRVIPDYTNQLDLFSEAAEETASPAPNGPVRSSGFQGRPKPPEQLRFLEWVPLPSDDASKIPEAKPPPASPHGDGDTPQRSPEQTGLRQQDQKSPGVGAVDRRIFTRSVIDIEPAEKPSRDFRITARASDRTRRAA